MGLLAVATALYLVAAAWERPALFGVLLLLGGLLALVLARAWRWR